MNFLMWFGNTTIVLMAGIMGIDQTLFEAATIDGANAVIIFIITSILGGVVYKFLSAQYKDPVEKPRRVRKGARK